MPIEIYPLKTEILQENFDLTNSLREALLQNNKKLKNGDVIIMSSKVVALSQGRVIALKNLIISTQAKKFLSRTRYGKGREDWRMIEIIAREADAVLPGKMMATLKDGFLVPSAGVDRSNAPTGQAILWPKNPAQVALQLWKNFKKIARVKNLGIVIGDSNCQPLKWGTVGLALAWAGFEGVEDVRGQKDIYGQKLQFTRKAVADNLVSSSLLIMGEGSEKIPFVLIRGAPVKFTSRQQKKNEIFAKPEDCLFGGIYSKKFLALVK